MYYYCHLLLLLCQCKLMKYKFFFPLRNIHTPQLPLQQKERVKNYSVLLQIPCLTTTFFNFYKFVVSFAGVFQNQLTESNFFPAKSSLVFVQLCTLAASQLPFPSKWGHTKGLTLLQRSLQARKFDMTFADQFD